MPLRDDRRGRRATLGPGDTPFRPEFSCPAASAITPAPDATRVPAQVAASADLPDIRAASDAPGAERSERSQTVFSEARTHATPPADPTQQRSLVEPSAVLVALVRPFFGLRSALLRFMNVPEVSGRGASDATAALDEFRADTTRERSFASEVASLLGAPIQPAQFAERPDASTTAAVPAEPVTAIADLASSFAPLLSPPETTTRDDRTNEFGASEGDRCQAAHARNIGGPSKPAEASEASVASDVVITHSLAEQNIVVAAIAFRPERAVPITRLPLRPQGLDITWPSQIPDIERGGSLSRVERHRLLERFVRHPGNVSSDTIARAYREEEGNGRTIALRVLLRNFPHAGRASFIEALRVGSDEERAVAVDGLTAIGARDELTPAFSDRVDAIAAKAALSYVGTFDRAHYREQLSEFIDGTQIDAILRLLAGIVE